MTEMAIIVLVIITSALIMTLCRVPAFDVHAFAVLSVVVAHELMKTTI